VCLEAGELRIFQEWVPGGSIADLLKKYGPFRDEVTRVYATQIVRGLEYLHSRDIVHRDIKAREDGGERREGGTRCARRADAEGEPVRCLRRRRRSGDVSSSTIV
jgi:serine/threonine protein kinase